MILVHFVGDGPLDGHTVPVLVETLLGARIRPTFQPWPRLNGRGWKAKLRFATLQAKDHEANALVATIDADRDDNRIRDLRAGRDEQRAVHPPFPTALGQARPHGEAWLLDDQVAVRAVLRLEATAAIPSPRRVRSPKDALTELLRNCSRCDEPRASIWREIAEHLDPARCMHADATGFDHFAKEVKAELRSLVGDGSTGA